MAQFFIFMYWCHRFMINSAHINSNAFQMILRSAIWKYVVDELSLDEARQILETREPSIEHRMNTVEFSGLQAYTTACGWLNYTNEEVVNKIKVCFLILFPQQKAI